MHFTLENLRKKVEATRRQLKEEEAALRVYERWSGNKDEDVLLDSLEKEVSSLGSTGKINLDKIKIKQSATRKSSLGSDIRSLVDRFEDQEFTINHVDAVLKQIGKGSTAKHFRNRIYVTIRKLLDEGVLVRTHQGVGNEPHRFRLASKSDNNVTALSASSNKKEN